MWKYQIKGSTFNEQGPLCQKKTSVNLHGKLSLQGATDNLLQSATLINEAI